MIGIILNWLRGAERLRQRGDQFFLSGEFGRAATEYEKAKSILNAGDYRRVTIEALLRECVARAGGLTPKPDSSNQPTSQGLAEQGHDLADTAFEPRQDTGGGPEIPELDEFFELAIGDKAEGRRKLYLGQGRDFRAGYVALVQGDPQRAVDLLKKALSRTAAPFVVQLELGRALSLHGQLSESEQTLTDAYDVRPDDIETRILLAAVQIELADYEPALRKLEELSQQGEAGPEFTFLYGRCLAGVGRLGDALQAYRETVRIEPHFHEAFFEAGQILTSKGDSEAAFGLLRRACELAPDEIPYNRSLAQLVLDERLDAETGLSAADRLMVTDEAGQWQYLSWISEFYVRRGWKREAKDPLRRALELVPESEHRERVEMQKRLAELES